MNFSGSTSLDILRRDLSKAALIDYDNKTKIVSLTEKGKKFVQWLIDNGQKASISVVPNLPSGKRNINGISPNHIEIKLSILSILFRTRFINCQT